MSLEANRAPPGYRRGDVFIEDCATRFSMMALSGLVQGIFIEIPACNRETQVAGVRLLVEPCFPAALGPAGIVEIRTGPGVAKTAISGNQVTYTIILSKEGCGAHRLSLIHI